MEYFRISATADSPNYLPQYLADDLGFFNDEGIKVVTTEPDPWPGVLDELNNGKADAVLGGAWLPAIFYGRVCRYKIFAQVNGRYPLALLSRMPVTGDSWDWLIGKVVVVPSSGGAAAYMLLAGLLREMGINPDTITFVRDLSHEMLADLFAGGLGDAMVTYMVNAMRLVDAGHAYLATSLDTVSGPMPNSVYYTKEEILSTKGYVAARFSRAIQRAINWIAENGVAGTVVRDLLARRWPDEDQGLLQRVVSGFHSNGLWSDGVRLNAGALARWQRLLVEGSLLETPLAYDTLVDRRSADYADGHPWEELASTQDC